MDWLRQDLLALVQPLSPAQMAAKPEGKGRPLEAILEHIVESQGAYLRAGLVGKVVGLSDALRSAGQEPEAYSEMLNQVWRVSIDRLSAMTPEERSQRSQRGKATYTGRRANRRMLEHSWEHLVEIRDRLAMGLQRGNAAACA
jgi:uncharacterized damage-inducible protein DinB